MLLNFSAKEIRCSSRRAFPASVIPAAPVLVGSAAWNFSRPARSRRETAVSPRASTSWTRACAGVSAFCATEDGREGRTLPSSVSACARGRAASAFCSGGSPGGFSSGFGAGLDFSTLVSSARSSSVEPSLRSGPEASCAVLDPVLPTDSLPASPFLCRAASKASLSAAAELERLKAEVSVDRLVDARGIALKRQCLRPSGYYRTVETPGLPCDRRTGA